MKLRQEYGYNGSWFWSETGFPSVSDPFFMRGGTYESTISSTFCFKDNSGTRYYIRFVPSSTYSLAL